MRERTQAEPHAAGQLMRELERTLWAGEERSHLVPKLTLLERISDHGSEAWRFAVRSLATIAAERDPWRASLLARALLAEAPDDDAAWAALALAQSILGNTRYAVACYRRAIALGGRLPVYLHNLGHLYDVCLGRPAEAVPLLEAAWSESQLASVATRTEMAASLAHALARAGEPRRALDVLSRALGRGRTRAHANLLAWIEGLVAAEQT
jgi:Flp pilus assembly protein TadD